MNIGENNAITVGFWLALAGVKFPVSYKSNPNNIGSNWFRVTKDTDIASIISELSIKDFMKISIIPRTFRAG